MADITDVADALVNVIVDRLYPNGTGGGGAYPKAVKVYAGWPDPQQLQTDLAAGVLHVSVFKLPMERDASRYDASWLEKAVPAATYSAAILGNTVTLTGTAPNPYAPQNIAVGVQGLPYAFVVTAADAQSVTSISAALGALIEASVPGVVINGADITIPEPYRLQFARIGVTGEAMREVGRSDTGFQITVWAPDHDDRTALAKVLEPRLASIVRLPLADGSSARLTRRGSTDMDKAQGQGAYRRDLVYSVEYAITETVAATQIVAVEVALQEPGGQVIAEVLE